MPSLAVCLDGSGDHFAMLVVENRRVDEPLGAMLDRVCVGRMGVRDLECDVPYTVAMSGNMAADRGASPHLTADHEPRAAGLEHVLGAAAETLLRTPIGGAGHPEGGRVVVRSLLGVADQEVDEIDPLHRERVSRDVVRDGTDELVDVVRGHRPGAALLIAHDWPPLAAGSIRCLERTLPLPYMMRN